MRWLTLIALIGLALPATAAERQEREVSHLKIRPQAHVQGDTATLADVLVLSQADSQLRTAIAHQPVVTDLHAPLTTAVSHEQIERRLEELGVNMAQVLIGGAATCRVTLEPAAQPADGSAGDNAAQPLLRPQPLDAGRTLAQVLRDYVDAELAELGGTAEVEFERASQPFLELTTPPWEFSIRSHGSEKLGLREFRVAIRRDGETHRTARVSARIRLSKAVLVARRPLNVGAFVERDTVALETRVFEQERDLGFHCAEEVVGQRVGRFVPTGHMVRRGDLETVDLIRRSRPVTVIGTGRNVHVRLTGVALDSGGYGDVVRVRIGDSRKSRRMLRGVVTGLGTVRVEEQRL